jgi:2-dehydro-3-deoxyphosphogluconate aldolase/(4S)-4-hydroxy-2-oxoglutarate aldolase
MESRTHMHTSSENLTANDADVRRSGILDRILATGVVAVVRMSDPQKLIRIVEAIREGGIQAIEITMTTPNALAAIEEVARTMGDNVEIGVGSVLDVETGRRAIESGARYIVCPIFKPEIVRLAHEHGLPAMPGAFTPTEIQAATESGADIVKVFPADIVGMPFFKAVLAPMPDLKLMPTGGVSLTNAGDWIRAGAVAVGVGSALLDKTAIADDDYALLTENARKLRRSVESGRSS